MPNLPLPLMIPLARIIAPILICISGLIGLILVEALPARITELVDSHTLCAPASTFDILIFFLTNYFAHAVTVKSFPGESGLAKYVSYAAALFFPSSGLVRGLNAWARCAIFTKGALERAARSGALCMVVRNERWQPDDGMQVRDMRLRLRSAHVDQALARVANTLFPPAHLLQKPIRTVLCELWHRRPVLAMQIFTLMSNVESYVQNIMSGAFSRTSDRIIHRNEWTELQNGLALEVILGLYIPPGATESSLAWSFRDTIDFYVDLHSREVHGGHRLPAGYSFAYVPRNAKVLPSARGVAVVLPPQSSVPKSIAGLVQGIYSSFTLYKTRGGQVNRYGYAAFGLTVLPYTVMTLFNLIGNVLTPDYQSLYLVESPTLLEARRRPDAVFNGVIGKLIPVDEGQGPSAEDSSPLGPQEVTTLIDPAVGEEFLATFETDIDDLGIHNTRVKWDEWQGFSMPRLGLDMDTDLEDLFAQSTLRRSEPNALPLSTPLDVLTLPAVWYQLNLRRPHISLQFPACARFEIHDSNLSAKSARRTTWGLALITMAVNCAIIVILGSLSDWFRSGNSTVVERFWTMTWLAFGLGFGLYHAVFFNVVPLPLARVVAHYTPQMLNILLVDFHGEQPLFLRQVVLGLRVLVYCIPAVGGFVVVGKMIRAYGTCTNM
ncbi:hypothetical protein DFH06DRAFT_1255598 [Mycena polygramma]|nr:hypothetical protein DFH06DRAFT_1255598 [Mycena polygramma]